MQQGKLESIQSLRGIAAILVVIHHAMNMVEEQAGAGSSLIVSAFRNNDFGAGGVDLFFVISGFVMSVSLERTSASNEAITFLRRRFLRIIPLFWIMACLFADLKYMQGEGPTLAAVANTVFILPIIDAGRYDLPILSVGWTLAFEFIFYGIVAVSMVMPASKRQTGVIGALALLSLIGVFARPENNAAAILINPILLEFLLGVCIHRLTHYRIDGRLMFVSFVAGLLWVGWSALVSRGLDMDPWAVIAGDTSLARVIAWGIPWALIVFGCTKMPNRGNILTRFGDASYSIYLTHMIVLTIVSMMWNRFDNMPADFVLLVYVLLAIFWGFLTFTLVEKPLAHLLSRMPASFGKNRPPDLQINRLA